jgi:DNA gyrase/topoisomerase IV subunit B
MGPLYITKDSKHPYLVTKAEYYALFADNVCSNMTLINSHKEELNKRQMKALIEANKDYLDELKPIMHYYTVNNEIIEFAILHKGGPNFGKNLKKRFPELKYDAKSETIEGSYNGADQYLEIGHGFYDRCTRLSKIIHDVNNGSIYYNMIDKGVKYPDIVSLGTFFLKNTKYMPPVVKRIKGIGELNSKILWDTTLNPQNRELIQLTIEDIKRELDTVRILHGPDVTLRKKFMEEYNFNRDDIDN